MPPALVMPLHRLPCQQGAGSFTYFRVALALSQAASTGDPRLLQGPLQLPAGQGGPPAISADTQGEHGDSHPGGQPPRAVVYCLVCEM